MSVPRIVGPLPGPKARALIERDARAVSPSYTRGYPLVIERAWGSTVEDVDGNLFLDCTAGIAVNATGHSHPDIVRAITGKGEQRRFSGHGECFIETGDGKAGFGSGNFYADPAPAIRLKEPSMMLHLGKVIYEKFWLYRRF